MSRVLEVNSPAVVGEIIDGEAVIMNLKSGNYYSTDKVGSVLWGMIEKGADQQTMLDLLGAHYDADPNEIAKAIEVFLDELVANDLVRAPANGAGENGRTALSAEDLKDLNGQSGFTAPVLNTYADMQDLLLLDPIHDVDEGGWPAPRPAESDD